MIILNKLRHLELSNLPIFKSFCSDTFNFPLLEQVIVKICRRMNIFCGGVLCTPRLRGILFDDEQQWEGNLNASIASNSREWVRTLVMFLLLIVYILIVINFHVYKIAAISLILKGW